jgi:hypothetical protein
MAVTACIHPSQHCEITEGKNIIKEYEATIQNDPFSLILKIIYLTTKILETLF